MEVGSRTTSCSLAVHTKEALGGKNNPLEFPSEEHAVKLDGERKDIVASVNRTDEHFAA